MDAMKYFSEELLITIETEIKRLEREKDRWSSILNPNRKVYKAKKEGSIEALHFVMTHMKRIYKEMQQE